MKLNMKQMLLRAQPDPFVCQTEDGWVMYTTGMEGVEVYSAKTPLDPWEYRGKAVSMPGCREYWAPCMYEEQGTYYLYFSCQEVDAEELSECLHVAKADSPYGPFTQPKRLFDCFSIDPHVVRTKAGLFLWYCLDRLDTDRVGTRIFVQKLADPMTPEGEPVEKVKPSFDEEIFMRDRYLPGQHWHTIEGAFWLQVEDWQYVMYSGACYQNDTYHIGYAAAKTQEQDLRKVQYEKYTDRGGFAPLMTKDATEEGVGHHSVILWQGQYYAVYHARDYAPNPHLGSDQRTARICKLHFADGEIRAEKMD